MECLALTIEWDQRGGYYILGGWRYDNDSNNRQIAVYTALSVAELGVRIGETLVASASWIKVNTAAMDYHFRDNPQLEKKAIAEFLSGLTSAQIE